MPNSISSTGITTATQAELLANLTAKLQAIYGNDIVLTSNTPDGQRINIYIQMALDLQDLLSSINAQFDPDQAVGAILDQRVAINGIQRQAGTFTVTPITLTLSQSVNLYGLDQSTQPVYTVQDNSGNQWQLQTTQLGLSPGSHVLNFQAANPGAVLTTPNTITVPVTIVLGVTSVNNPTTYTTLGINEETDAALRIRRQQSVSLASQGYLAGLEAALKNISGVTYAFVEENTSASTNGDGVPGHSIWVIVAGTGAAASIAQAIYTKRNAGCGMYGSISYSITQADGTSFNVFWDSVVAQDLFIQFTASSINGTANPNISAILSRLPNIFTPGVFTEVNINELATLVQEIDPNTLVTSAGLSTALVQTLSLSGVAASGAFKVTYNGNSSASIAWNDSISTIQSKVQAVSGLSTCLVTGSIASQSLVFTLTSATGLIVITSNTLQTGGSVAITFSYNEGYQNTLLPTTKKNQFVVSPGNIVILPILLTPSSSTVAPAATVQFTALGGYSTITFSISTNNSGGSINSSTGLYTAGASPGTDIIKVTDMLGNTATATVTVT